MVEQITQKENKQLEKSRKGQSDQKTTVSILPKVEGGKIQPLVARLSDSFRYTIIQNGLTKTGIFVFVIIPTAIIGIFLTFIASDAYVSEAKFSVKSENSAVGSLDLAASIFSTQGSTFPDAYILQDYIHSPDLLVELEKKLKLRGHYGDKKYDFFFRLATDASKEDFIAYWQSKVKIAYEPESGVIGIRVKAFTREIAQSICKAILGQCETLINQMNDRALEDTLSMAYKEVERAEKRVFASRESLKVFRDEKNMLDPGATAQSLLKILSQLEGQAIETRAELREALTYMREDSPKIEAIKRKLEAIESQLKEEKQRLSGTMKYREKLSAVVGEYEQLVTESEFAKNQYLSALASLEAARIRANSKSRYIVAYQQPTLPDESIFPRPIYHTVLTGILATMTFFIFSLLIAAIREHSGY